MRSWCTERPSRVATQTVRRCTLSPTTATYRSAVVTGATGVLGAALIRALASAGVSTAACSRSGLCDVASEHVVQVRVDLASDDSIDAAAKTVAERLQSVDLVINNAGISSKTVSTMDPATVSTLGRLNRDGLAELHNVNAIGPVLLIQALRSFLSPRAVVINVSSDRSEFGHRRDVIGNYGYRMSKAALNMATECLSSELDDGVTVVSVHPGGFKSPMNGYGPLEADDVALRLLDSIPALHSLNGQYVNLDRFHKDERRG